MKSSRRVYICPVCHMVFTSSQVHHTRRTQVCEIGLPGDERSKPLYDEKGQLLTRAPRWWVEACRMQHPSMRPGRAKSKDRGTT